VHAPKTIDNPRKGDAGMAKLSRDTVFTSTTAAKETTLDKTTRIVREITEGEAEKRQTKMARLRAARLEREANTPAEQTAAPTRKTAKKTPGKTAGTA
jgi:hypothetical protein